MANPRGFSQTGIELLYAELAKRGISPAAASGAIAGIMGESGANLDPTSFNTQDPGGGSGGIGQWNRDRLIGSKGLLAFAQNAGVSGINVNTPSDAKKVPLAIQAQYLGHELDTSYAGVTDQLKAAKTPQDALNVWVNSYENPADKRAAIAQRSQYLDPVSKALTGVPAQPATPASATTPIGTTLTSLGGGGTGVFPGTTQQQSNDILKNFGDLDKALGGQGIPGQPGGEQPQAPQPPPMMPAMARNISPLGGALLPNAPQMAELWRQKAAQPMQWSSAPQGASPYANVGLQAQPSPYGTTLTSMMMGQEMSPLYSAFYGGSYG